MSKNYFILDTTELCSVIRKAQKNLFFSVHLFNIAYLFSFMFHIILQFLFHLLQTMPCYHKSYEYHRNQKPSKVNRFHLFAAPHNPKIFFILYLRENIFYF